MIKINNVSKTFKNIVLQDVSYEFIAGQCYYLTGESGTGKTTLLNIIFGYDDDFEGEVIKKGKIEYMFQEHMLFENLTVADNLQMKLLAKKDKEVIELSELKDALRKVNLDVELEKKVNSLSGGEKQRLQLAQYVLTAPDVLLLDEPACKLDANNKEKIYSVINEVFGDKTRIIVTHDEEINFNNGISLELREGKLWEVQKNG